MKGFFFSGFLALGVLAGLPGTASAQPVINSPFYEESKTISCGSSNNCDIHFTSPSDRMRFTKLNCAMSTFDTNVLEVYFGVKDTTQNTPRRQEYFPFDGPKLSQLGLRYYAFSAPMDFLFAPGKVPYFRVVLESVTGTGTVRCKITGQIELSQ